MNAGESGSQETTKKKRMTAEFSGIGLPMAIAFRSVCGLEGVPCSPISIHRESHAPPRSAPSGSSAGQWPIEVSVVA